MRHPLLVLALVAAPTAAMAQAPLPLKMDPKQTAAAVTADDLKTRLYVFADDSMMGREAGTIGHDRATDYIARELKRLGLQPAGENGGYFQIVPLVERAVGPTTSLSVDGARLAIWDEFAPFPSGARVRPIDGAQVVYGGAVNDSSTWITAEEAAGKFVVLSFSPAGRPAIFLPPNNPFKGGAAIAITGVDNMLKQYGNYLRQPQMSLQTEAASQEMPATMLLATAAASKLLGAEVGTLQPGAAGKTVAGALVVTETPRPSRNVVAVLPGGDPKLKGQYVSIGAHSDHDGIAATAVDHDSLRIFNAMLRKGGAEGQPQKPTDEQARQLAEQIAAARQKSAPRLDSIMNGADDDGSGSVAVLEIAEAMAMAKQKPKRSTLFVWHTAEEKGLVGARWYTDNPTVPRDSIVANLNIDMIGRGTEQDEEKGGADYLQLIGARRLSRELGAAIDEVNSVRETPFRFDYTLDADGHPANIYCRSDHAMYARYGIPVAFFTTGGHRDYHMLTDEPQYVDYTKLENVTQLIRDVALKIANGDRRPAVDGVLPASPNAPCKQ